MIYRKTLPSRDYHTSLSQVPNKAETPVNFLTGHVTRPATWEKGGAVAEVSRRDELGRM